MKYMHTDSVSLSIQKWQYLKLLSGVLDISYLICCACYFINGVILFVLYDNRTWHFVVNLVMTLHFLP